MTYLTLVLMLGGGGGLNLLFFLMDRICSRQYGLYGICDDVSQHHDFLLVEISHALRKKIFMGVKNH